MPWIFLIFAGLLEIVWAVSLKLSDGFTRPGYSILTLAGMLASFYLLSQAVKTLPIGMAYVVWMGIGALGVVVIGILFFKEPLNMSRLCFTLLILVGIMGLKFAPH